MESCGPPRVSKKRRRLCFVGRNSAWSFVLFSLLFFLFLLSEICRGSSPSRSGNVEKVTGCLATGLSLARTCKFRSRDLPGIERITI